MMNQSQQTIKLTDLNTDTPIDIEAAVSGLGGDPSIFYMMLGNFEKMTLLDHINKMKDAYDNDDHSNFKEYAHSIKGSSGYIGASRLYYACYFIQEHYVFERFDLQMQYYPTFVEAAIEFKTFSRKIIAENDG